MLDKYGLWIISEILGVGSLFLGFQQGTVLRIILFISGCASLLLGVLALCKEVEFSFANRGHRALLVGPFIGGLFSVANLFRVVCDTIGESYSGIALIAYLVILIAAIVLIVKRFWKKKNQN